jgi:hypothetical protein
VLSHRIFTLASASDPLHAPATIARAAPSPYVNRQYPLHLPVSATLHFALASRIQVPACPRLTHIQQRLYLSPPPRIHSQLFQLPQPVRVLVTTTGGLRRTCVLWHRPLRKNKGNRAKHYSASTLPACSSIRTYAPLPSQCRSTRCLARRDRRLLLQRDPCPRCPFQSTEAPMSVRRHETRCSRVLPIHALYLRLRCPTDRLPSISHRRRCRRSHPKLVLPDRCPLESRCARQSASVPFHNHPDMGGGQIQPVRCRRVRRLAETWSIGECHQYPKVKRLLGIIASRSHEAPTSEEREACYQNHLCHLQVYLTEARILSQ